MKLNLDCLILIIKKLQNDKNSLHSCLLVNKEWCNIIVPILWKHSLNVPIRNVFEIILSCLSSSSKQILINNDIKLPLLTKTPLFNYISFCKFPVPGDVNGIIEMVLGKLNSYDKKSNILEREIYKLFISQCKNIES